MHEDIHKRGAQAARNGWSSKTAHTCAGRGRQAGGKRSKASPQNFSFRPSLSGWADDASRRHWQIVRYIPRHMKRI
jgi:hypothetical protein